MSPKPFIKASFLNPNRLKLFRVHSRSPQLPPMLGYAETSWEMAAPAASLSSLNPSHIDSVLPTAVPLISDPKLSSNHTHTPESAFVPADLSRSPPATESSTRGLQLAEVEIPAVSSRASDTKSFSTIMAVGFNGFKTVLRLIERGTDIFPPLKSTAACLLGLIDLVEVRECL